MDSDIKIEVLDSELRGFNSQSRDELKANADRYISEVIREANRIEASRNTTNGDPEVTSTMVSEADMLLRRNHLKPRKSKWYAFTRVLAAVLSLIVGFLYDSTKLQDTLYMLIFILVVAAAIFAVTISALQE